MNCKHYIIDRKCNAFTDEIPLEIWQGDNNHSKPLPDQDNDIVFEPNKGGSMDGGLNI